MDNKITDLKVEPCEDAKYIKVQKVTYTQNNVQKTWEMTLTHDSVSILIVDKQNNEFIFVKQFRPPVYFRNNDGFTYELCAGIVDKELPLKQIAKEEVLEECGYQIDDDDITKMRTFFSSVGFAGAKQSLFFAFVDDSKKVSQGGGIDNENIEVIRCDIDKVYDFLTPQIPTTPALLYAVGEYYRLYKK